jgi:hypothetical protein
LESTAAWILNPTTVLLVAAPIEPRCVRTTQMSSPWILRRLANFSPFFHSLSNRLRITNYCLRSVSSSLLKFTRFIQGNNIAWTNLDISGIYNTCIWIRSPIPIKHYLLIDIDFFSKLKVSCGPSNNNHCKLLMANVLQWKQGPMLIRRLWWVSPKSLYTHIPKKQVNISKYSKKKRWLLNIWPNFKVQGP